MLKNFKDFPFSLQFCIAIVLYWPVLTCKALWTTVGCFKCALYKMFELSWVGDTTDFSTEGQRADAWSARAWVKSSEPLMLPAYLWCVKKWITVSRFGQLSAKKKINKCKLQLLLHALFKWSDAFKWKGKTFSKSTATRRLSLFFY